MGWAVERLDSAIGDPRRDHVEAGQLRRGQRAGVAGYVARVVEIERIRVITTVDGERAVDRVQVATRVRGERRVAADIDRVIAAAQAKDKEGKER